MFATYDKVVTRTFRKMAQQTSRSLCQSWHSECNNFFHAKQQNRIIHRRVRVFVKLLQKPDARFRRDIATRNRDPNGRTRISSRQDDIAGRERAHHRGTNTSRRQTARQKVQASSRLGSDQNRTHATLDANQIPKRTIARANHRNGRRRDHRGQPLERPLLGRLQRPRTQRARKAFDATSKRTSRPIKRRETPTPNDRRSPKSPIKESL